MTSCVYANMGMDFKLLTHSQLFSQELHTEWVKLRDWLKTRAGELGFGEVRITDTDVSSTHPHLLEWLHAGRHGQMA